MEGNTRMNALELADLLETTESTNNRAAIMLRQQAAEIEAGIELVRKLQEEREALKDEVAEWKMSYENSQRFEAGYGHN
jgi:hypothetical protein